MNDLFALWRWMDYVYGDNPAWLLTQFPMKLIVLVAYLRCKLS
jgi:hypothetical protein